MKKKWKKRLLKYYIQFFSSKPKIGDNILITSTDGIGDNIVRLRILEELLKVFGKERCYILAEAKVKAFLEKIGFQKIIVFDNKKRNTLRGKIELWRNIVSIPWQEVISLEFDQHDFDIEYLAEIPNIGYDNVFHPEMNFHYRRIVPIQKGKIENTVKYFFEEYFQCKISGEEIIPELKKYYQEKSILSKTITVGVGAGDRYKILTPFVLAKIFKIFAQKKSLSSFYLLGFGKKEKSYVEELKNYISFQDFGIESYVDKLSFEESVGMIQKSEYYLGMDSGLFHVAAALKKETYGIFTEEHFFSHENWKNVNIFYGRKIEKIDEKQRKEEYYGNEKLNNIDVMEIEKRLS